MAWPFNAQGRLPMPVPRRHFKAGEAVLLGPAPVNLNKAFLRTRRMSGPFGQIEAIAREAFGPAIRKAVVACGELTLHIHPGSLAEVLGFLKSDPRIRMISLVDMAAFRVEEPGLRVNIAYHLLSPSLNLRLRVKLSVEAGEAVASAAHLFPVAARMEDDIRDALGMLFCGGGPSVPTQAVAALPHADWLRLLAEFGLELKARARVAARPGETLH